MLDWRLLPASASFQEANDCHHPAGSPEGGQFCSSGGLTGIGRKLWRAYALTLGRRVTAQQAESALLDVESDSEMADIMKDLAEKASAILTPAELRALTSESVTVAFKGELSVADEGERGVVYHGTTESNAAKIRSAGKLVPRAALKSEGNWSTGLFGGMPSNPRLVYTTTDRRAAEDYAKETVRKHGGIPAVVALKPDWGRAVPDEDVVAGFMSDNRPSTWRKPRKAGKR